MYFFEPQIILTLISSSPNSYRNSNLVSFPPGFLFQPWQNNIHIV